MSNNQQQKRPVQPERQRRQMGVPAKKKGSDLSEKITRIASEQYRAASGQIQQAFYPMAVAVGSALASSISYAEHYSIPKAIFHALLSWGYVIYMMIERW